MMKQLPGVGTCVLAVLAGVVLGAAGPFVGDAIGAWLENVSGQTFRAWEMAVLQVAIITIPGGAVVAAIGAFCKRWTGGLVVGAVLHALIFLIIVATTNSMQNAPATVRYWVLTVGVITGAGAGSAGGLISQVAVRRKVE